MEHYHFVLNYCSVILNLFWIYFAVRISLFTCAGSEVIKNKFTFKISEKLLIFLINFAIFFARASANICNQFFARILHHFL